MSYMLVFECWYVLLGILWFLLLAKGVDPSFLYAGKWCQKPEITKCGMVLPCWTLRECETFSVWLRYNQVQRPLKTHSRFDFRWGLRKQSDGSNYYLIREAAYAAFFPDGWTKIFCSCWKCLTFSKYWRVRFFQSTTERTCQKPWPIFTLHHHEEWCSHLHHHHHHGNEAVIGLYFPIQPKSFHYR